MRYFKRKPPVNAYSRKAGFKKLLLPIACAALLLFPNYAIAIDDTPPIDFSGNSSFSHEVACNGTSGIDATFVISGAGIAGQAGVRGNFEFQGPITFRLAQDEDGETAALVSFTFDGDATIQSSSGPVRIISSYPAELDGNSWTVNGYVSGFFELTRFSRKYNYQASGTLIVHAEIAECSGDNTARISGSLNFAGRAQYADGRSNFETVFVSTWRETDGICYETYTDFPSAVYRVEPFNSALIPIAIGFDHLVLGACGPDGYLYFAERGAHQVVRVSQDGQRKQAVFRMAGKHPWDSPEGPSFDQEGNLYFTHTAIGGAWKLDHADPGKSAIQVVRQFGVRGSYIAGAGTAVLTTGPYAGDLLVVNLEASIIYRISPQDFCTQQGQPNCGQPQEFITEHLDRPYGIALSSQGDIFVSNFDGGVINRYNPEGEYLGEFTKIGGAVAGIAFDSNGDLWAVSNNAVFKVSPSGEKTHISSIPWEGAGIAICKP